MKKRAKLIYIAYIAIFFELIFLIIVQHIYNGVFDIGSLFGLLLTLLISSIFRDFDILDYKSDNKNKFLIVEVILLLSIPIYIFCSKPQYTYNKAINIISSNFNESIKVGRNDYSIYITDESKKIRKGYVISVEIGNETVDYLFDPWEGGYLKLEEDQ